MLRLDANRSVSFCDGLTRRDFLHAGALPTLGLTLPGLLAQRASAAPRDRDVNCIMLFLVGGPSHIDTFDPKPNAPAEVRGPFQPIRTSVPGTQLTEIFPKTAKRADRFSLVRSVYHTATAVHDTGHQMMQTGRLFSGGIEYPHVGSVIESRVCRRRAGEKAVGVASGPARCAAEHQPRQVPCAAAARSGSDRW